MIGPPPQLEACSHIDGNGDGVVSFQAFHKTGHIIVALCPQCTREVEAVLARVEGLQHIFKLTTIPQEDTQQPGTEPKSE